MYTKTNIYGCYLLIINLKTPIDIPIIKNKDLRNIMNGEIKAIALLYLYENKTKGMHKNKNTTRQNAG